MLYPRILELDGRAHVQLALVPSCSSSIRAFTPHKMVASQSYSVGLQNAQLFIETALSHAQKSQT